MTINELMEKKKITKYRLSKESGIAYTTINDICNGKVHLNKCTGETIYRISKTLGISMEQLIESYLYDRVDFELFKSNVCHRLKALGDIDFIIELLSKNKILEYYNKKYFPECFYLLAMLDYLSRENDIPLCTDYEYIRNAKLKDYLFPKSVLVMSHVMNDDDIKKKAISEAIPEFLRFNIIESEVRNVA